MLYGWQLLTNQEEDLVIEGVRNAGVCGGPFHLVLLPTDHCNVDCFFCSVAERRKHLAQLPWPLLRQAILDGIGMGVKSVCFTGGGEPLIYPQIRELLKLLAEHQIQIDSMNTNGTALTPGMCEALMTLSPHLVRVSVNETTQDQYVRTMKTTARAFDQVIRGITNLASAKVAHDCNTEINVQVFAWKESYQYLLEMIETAFDLGADTVYANSLELLPPEQRLTSDERETLRALAKTALERWPGRVQLNLKCEGITDLAPGQHHKLAFRLAEEHKPPTDIAYCLMPWYAAVISPNGDVATCCEFSFMPERQIGNLHSTTLFEIWHGERASLARSEIRELLMAKADARFMEKDPRFLHAVCTGRCDSTDCAFNFYLGSARVYSELDSWADNGPRQRFIASQRISHKIQSALSRLRAITAGKKPNSSPRI